MKLPKCITCGTIPEPDDNFCEKCGSPVANFCSNNKGKNPCNTINRTTAAYCTQCGSPTRFNLSKLINVDYEKGKRRPHFINLSALEDEDD